MSGNHPAIEGGRGRRVWSALFCSLLLHGGGDRLFGADTRGNRTPEDDRGALELRLTDARVFADVVQPMFEQRCVSCHGPEKSKGGLLLDSHAAIVEGSDAGDVVVPGRPDESELYLRITLDKDHDDFMPSGGKTPLTAGQVAVVRWWIEAGVPAEGRVADFAVSDATRTLLRSILDPAPAKNRWPLPAIGPADPVLIAELERQGFEIQAISEKVAYLDVGYRAASGLPPDAAAWKALLGIRDHVVWLNMGRAGLSDEHLVTIARFPNLMRLSIPRNPVTARGLAALAGLDRLEVLNAYGTSIDDEVWEVLPQFGSLIRVYLWQTGVTPERARTYGPATVVAEYAPFVADDADAVVE